MPANPEELRVQLLNTLAWLDLDGEQVVLTRGIYESHAGGKRKTGTQDLDPQTFIMSPTLVSTTTEARTGSRNSRTDDMVGLPDADIQRGDTFEYQGTRYEVRTVIRWPFQVNVEAVTSG
jgi:hypothetical protein